MSAIRPRAVARHVPRLVDRGALDGRRDRPDSRYLLASRGGVTVSAWTAEDLAAEIRRETGAR